MANNSGPALLVLLIAGALIVLVLFSGTILTGATEIFNNINAGIASFMASLGGTTGLLPTPTPTAKASPSPGSSPTPTPVTVPLSAESWFAFTLHFSDGTSQNVNMNPTLSILPLSIMYEGKTLTSMDVYIMLKVTGSNLGPWTTTASQHIEVYYNGATIPATSSTGQFNDAGSSWTSGQAQTILDTPLTADQISSALNQYGYGTWVFQTTGYVSLTISQGSTQAQTLTATMGQNDITLVNSNTSSICTIIGTHLTTTQLKPTG